MQFSIVIPVRNGANYLKETLECVFAQTYDDFNVILLENCSEDNTVEIAQSFNDPRVKIIPATEPLNIEDNWARILDLELNEYLVLLCHDDIFEPGFLEEIAALIAAEPEASLYHTHFHFIDKNSIPITPCLPVPYKENAEEFLRHIHSYKENFVGSGYVMRSADFKKVGGYPKYMRLLFADGFCYYQLTGLSYKVCSPKFLCGFRRHGNSMSESARALQFLQASEPYLNDLRQTPYGASQENMALAYQFLLDVFIRPMYRRLLYDTILLGEPRQEQLHECEVVKNALIEAQMRDPLLNGRTFPAQIYEKINQISFWRPRIFVFRIVSYLASFAKQIWLRSKAALKTVMPQTQLV